jgi:hypothetical protein
VIVTVRASSFSLLLFLERGKFKWVSSRVVQTRDGMNLCSTLLYFVFAKGLE